MIEVASEFATVLNIPKVRIKVIKHGVGIVFTQSVLIISGVLKLKRSSVVILKNLPSCFLVLWWYVPVILTTQNDDCFPMGEVDEGEIGEYPDLEAGGGLGEAHMRRWGRRL